MLNGLRLYVNHEEKELITKDSKYWEYIKETGDVSRELIIYFQYSSIATPPNLCNLYFKPPSLVSSIQLSHFLPLVYICRKAPCTESRNYNFSFVIKWFFSFIQAIRPFLVSFLIYQIRNSIIPGKLGEQNTIVYMKMLGKDKILFKCKVLLIYECVLWVILLSHIKT